MNILFLISTLGLGGAEKQLLYWIRILQSDFDASSSVAYFSPSQSARLLTLEELEVPVIAVGRESHALRRVSKVVSFARRNRAEIIHAFNCYLSPVAVVAGAAVRAVPVSSFRGDGLSDLQALGGLLRRPTLKLVRNYTSNSRWALDQVKPFVRGDSLLQYVPNLVTLPRLPRRPKPHTESGRTVALAVGRLDCNKRLEVFLEALAIARSEEPGLTGVIVGEGPDRTALERRACQLGLLPDGVTFRGEVTDPAQNYASADVFVHLAESEGTPNVVLEAMSMELPVVTTPAGDLRFMVEPRQTGFLVPTNDPKTTAQRLIQLSRSSRLRAELGARGRKYVEDSHNIDAVRNSLDRFYAALRRPHESLRPRR